MKTIACLHTAGSNVAVFDAACPPGVVLRHTVNETLLKDAEAAGGLTEAIAARTARALEALAGPGVDAVLLTCSTVGPGVALARAPVPVLRVDAALAEAATKGGGRVVVLCAVETTMEPSRRVFEEPAARHGATLDVRLVPGAWAAFRGGDVAGYHRLVAEAAEAAFAEGAAEVALAQASMAGAVAMARGRKPLASPPVGLAAAVASA
ncbi:aspartate/glutamate racemase family protein [Roseomonas stagni]|uniref:Aspartate/glutamate racemase family protein n=1 Tax=Falsiroseomonas algicola TaxID=2716930 RepID=A0A6M1LJ09_9PROT|nr:aspartate/glutamate racemase family protein [Falsiroseomonas algicola]NGM19989.1 aspartate/glutamate racemase family protein [Falsiroseomonas algicola]